MYDEQPEFDLSEEMTDDDWLSVADRAYKDSDNYLDAGLRKRWEKNYSLARSEHPGGSKYHSDSYKHRSQVFRGKTHAAIRKNLAACAVALFSTQDVVSVKPEDDSKEDQKVSAKALDLLLNYHLDVDIPWYRTVNGAYREAMTNGVVFSKQYWKYEKEVDEGEEVIISDHPVIELIPPENVRISPGSDWLNPIATSPYVIVTYPMFVSDVKERMQLDWFEASDTEIHQALREEDFESIRTAREGEGKPDSKEESVSVFDHDIAWIRENFIRYDNKIHCYYTLGAGILLTDPMPINKVYPHCKDGKPPLRMGFSEIEPFSTYPQGMVERVEGTQIQANEIANQRFDNVRQVLNKRWLVKRNANVDYRSLTRNIPGSTTLTDDVEAVKPLITNDVTASSYQEQNLINMDFDELSGTFSTASVATNRQMNETVGGMQLLSGNSNVLTEFALRTFVESWVEPVLRDMVNLVKTYEDNDIIQKVTGQSINSQALQASTLVRVNVGFGATDPTTKVNRLMFAMMTIKNVLADPNMQKLGIDPEEFAAEIFGTVGYKDAARFIPGIKKDQNPQVQQLQEQLQQLRQELEKDTAKTRMQMEIEKMKAQNDIEVEQMRNADNREERRVRERLAEMELQKTAAELAMKEGVEIKKVMAMLAKVQVEGKIKSEIQEKKQADDLKSKLYTMQKAPDRKAAGYWPG